MATDEDSFIEETIHDDDSVFTEETVETGASQYAQYNMDDEDDGLDDSVAPPPEMFRGISVGSMNEDEKQKRRASMARAMENGLQFPRTVLGEAYDWLRERFPRPPPAAA